MLVSLGSILVNYAVASAMVGRAGMGIAGLAMTTSAVALFGFLVQVLILRNKIGGIHGRALRTQLGRIVAASVAMAAAVALSSYGVRAWLGISQLARVADVVLSLPLGLAVYYGAAKMLGLAEIDMVIRSFTGPIRRILGGRGSGERG